jgi:hypothetical protein
VSAVEQPPAREPDKNGPHVRRYEVRRKRHKHSPVRRILRTAGLVVVVLAAGVLLYFLLGWVTDSTYVIYDKVAK